MTGAGRKPQPVGWKCDSARECIETAARSYDSPEAIADAALKLMAGNAIDTVRAPGLGPENCRRWFESRCVSEAVTDLRATVLIAAGFMLASGEKETSDALIRQLFEFEKRFEVPR